MREFRWNHVNPWCILKDLLMNSWVVVLCAAIAWMGTQVVLENLYRPEYTSTATYFIAPKDSTNSTYSNINTGYQMAGVLGTILKSEILADKVSEAMGAEKLPARIETNIIEYTNLLRLQAVAASPEAAFRTVRTMMAVHPEVSDYVVNNAVAEVLEPPAVPVAPSNFIPLRSTQRTAALIAALLALAGLVVLSVLRDTVKTEEGMRELVDAPLYGTLPYEAKNKTLRSWLQQTNKAVLITNPVTSFRFAESVKRMCTKMEYASSLRGHKTFLVASASENEGKSTVAVNLALCLAGRGYRVLLIDGDFKRPAQYKLMEKPKTMVKDFSGFLRGKAALEEVLQQDEQTGLYLLINRHSYRNSSEQLASGAMAELMRTVTGRMDYVIVDSSPMALTSDTEVLSSLCTAALLIVAQDHAYVQTLNDAVDKLGENTELLGCVFNMARTLYLPGGSYGRKYETYYRKA